MLVKPNPTPRVGLELGLACHDIADVLQANEALRFLLVWWLFLDNRAFASTVFVSLTKATIMLVGRKSVLSFRLSPGFPVKFP